MKPMTWEAVEATAAHAEAMRAKNEEHGGFTCNRCADTGIVSAPEPYGSWGCVWPCPECPLGNARRRRDLVIKNAAIEARALKEGS